ncbi:MAG TPA: ABC transporter permease [Thermodesulfobacteriota bacterium]|nr:ABC transporter permease [Thermodesulfobacteriota bacterium]
MSWMRIRAMARKEFIHILRDPRSLGMGIAIPMIMLLLFGYALTLDVDQVPLMIWDQNRSQASREFVSHFLGSRYFALQGYADTYQELETAIDTRRALAAMVIPSDFAGRLAAGHGVKIQWIVDGSDSNTATIASGYAEVITATFSQDLVLRELQRKSGKSTASPVDVRPRVWFNADLESRNYIIPGLIAVIMMVIAALLTSLTVAKEWEQGTMEQLISTPVKAPELILGKLTPYFLIGIFDVLLAVLMGEFLFHVPLRGHVLLIFVQAAIFLMGTLSLGLLISIVTRNQLLASQFAMVATFLPAFLLSGFAYPIRSMPAVLQGITYIIPAKYFVILLKGIYLKGVGPEVLYGEALFLALFALLMFFLANKKFKKKLV